MGHGTYFPFPDFMFQEGNNGAVCVFSVCVCVCPCVRRMLIHAVLFLSLPADSVSV